MKHEVRNEISTLCQFHCVCLCDQWRQWRLLPAVTVLYLQGLDQSSFMGFIVWFIQFSKDWGECEHGLKFEVYHCIKIFSY